MKKSICLMLSFVMTVVMLAGCVMSASAEKLPILGAGIYSSTDNFNSFIGKAIKNASNGVFDCNVDDGQQDQSMQLNQIDTAIAMVYYRRMKCDIVVLEVGMGGEWDATNVIEDNEAAVIVNIGLDHTEVLGDTVEKIALTKSGVVKRGCPCVMYRQQPSVEAVFEAVCRKLDAPFTLADFAMGVAANLDNKPTLAIEANIRFFTGVKGEKLIGRCTADKAGRSVGFYSVEISDDLGTNIAHFTCTAHRS